MKETYLVASKLYEDHSRAGVPKGICGCCGASVQEGVKGCFALSSEVNIRGYNQPGYGNSFYGVDAHALQHPEIHGKKNNAAHLMRLHWIFEQGGERDASTVPKWRQTWLDQGDIPLLEPPTLRGNLTVVDVVTATSAQEHNDMMKQWAFSVYEAWNVHHEWVRQAFMSTARHSVLPAIKVRRK